MVDKPEIYLYGKDQIPLPKLPTWDREKHPKAAIVDRWNRGYRLIVSDSLSASDSGLWFGENTQAYDIYSTEFVLGTTTNSYENISSIVWANCNLYNFISEEVLVFEKSADPIWDTTEYSYCQYNGVLLPISPELPYEYAAIAWQSDTGIWLYCSDDPYCLTGDNKVNAKDLQNTLAYTNIGARWIRNESRVNHAISIFGDILWSNHDIIDVNGTVGEVGSIYFPKSVDPVPFEPVPVNPINPSVLMQGFVTMLSLRRNRT